MSAFAAAMDAVFADQHMAVDASWLPGGVIPPVSCRLILRAPDDVSEWGGARVVSGSMRADVRASEVASPAEGDVIEIGGERYVVSAAPVRDRDRLVWTLELVPE